MVSRMTAYEDQAEGFTLTTHAVLPGEVLMASTVSYCRWEGMEVVRVTRGTMPLCVEISEFSNARGLRTYEHHDHLDFPPSAASQNEGDTEALRASKTRLREILNERFTKNQIAAIFEESSLTKKSIADQLTSGRDPRVRWHNICMTVEERTAAGIRDGLDNRPGHPDDNMEYTIEERIPADAVCEDHFAEHVLAADSVQGDVLVLVGDMHVEPVARRLRAKGHTVEVFSELVPVKRWDDPHGYDQQ